MPTYIYFAGAGVYLKVEEDPGHVAEAFTAAGGLPFRVTHQDHGGAVYVNPATVAFWAAAESGPPPETPPEAPPDAPPSRRQREPVTDVWGQPLRKKRGRGT